MMKKNVLVLLYTSVLLVILSACSAKPASTASTAHSANTAAAPVDTSTSQYLGDFQAIPGTTSLYAQLSQKPATGSGLRSLISSISSSEDYGSTANLVFLDGKTLSSHKLFATNNQIILSVLQFPDPYAGMGSAAPAGQAQPAQPAQGASSKSNAAVQWLVYQVVQKDASQPSATATADLPFSIAVSDTSGNNYQELLGGVSKTYSMSMINSKQVLVVYTKNNIKTASLLDLTKQTVTASKPIVDLGAGVQ